MGVDFMRTEKVSAYIRGCGEIVRLEFDVHLPAVLMAVFIGPNGPGARRGTGA
jgi:hypothetical protein